MNELRRMRYLSAMGIDSYVSRTQLPGAAATRRLAIVPVQRERTASTQHPVAAVVEPRAQPAPEARGQAHIPKIDSTPRSPAPASAPGAVAAPVPAERQNVIPRFNLVAIVAGGWLWLEEMNGMPLASDQVQLVQAMAMTLDPAARLQQGQAKPEIAHFDWPIHTNQQLDLGEEAARASVAGFIGRKLEQRACLGLVLLGAACASRVPLEQLHCAHTLTTVSTAQMLEDPQLKQQAWRDLQPFANRE